MAGAATPATRYTDRLGLRSHRFSHLARIRRPILMSRRHAVPARTIDLDPDLWEVGQERLVMVSAARPLTPVTLPSPIGHSRGLVPLTDRTLVTRTAESPANRPLWTVPM